MKVSAASRAADGKPAREVNVYAAYLAMIDFIDNELPYMRSKGELMAHLIVWRQTHGWGKLCDAIGRKEFEKRTSLGRDAVRVALDAMADQGVVLVESTVRHLDIGLLCDRQRYTWAVNDRVQGLLKGESDSGGVGDIPAYPWAEKQPTPLAEKSPTRRLKSSPLNLVLNQSCTPSQSCKSEKATKADKQPTKHKKRVSPAVSVSFTAQPQTKEGYRGDWIEEDLEAVQNFIEDHEPEDTDDHGKGEWAAEATLNAGLGASAEDVVSFLGVLVESGWNAPNYRAFPAVVHHEFERRHNRALGKRWSESDLARLRVGLKQYMEGDEPPARFEDSCELRANGATAREVFDLLERKWANPKYRPGKRQGPRTWNWFLKVIGNEFNAAERGHLPEQPAAARPSIAEREALERGIDAIELPDAEAGAAA
jgi:hypothetical protein